MSDTIKAQFREIDDIKETLAKLVSGMTSILSGLERKAEKYDADLARLTEENAKLRKELEQEKTRHECDEFRVDRPLTGAEITRAIVDMSKPKEEAKL